MPPTSPARRSSTRRPTRWRRFAAVVATLAILVALAPTNAGGQDDGDTTTPATTTPATTTPATTDTSDTQPSDTVTPTTAPLPAGALTLMSQSGFVAADGEFDVQLGWTGPVAPELSISMTIRGKVSRESQLGTDTAVLNRPPAVPLVTVLQPDGSLRLQLPIRSFTQAGAVGSERVLIPDPGVYPVMIEIRDEVGTLASLRTYLVRLPTETAEIDLLPVSTILPVSSADGLTVADAITLLERHPTLPITVLLETGVVSELIDDPVAAEGLRAALGERTLIVGSTLDLDPSALAEIGQGQLYGDALESSRAVLVDLGLQPSTTTVPIEPALTVEGALLLRSFGVTTVFNADGGPNGVITTDAGPLRVTGVDEQLTSLLATRTGPVAAAHLLIARLALRVETDITPVLIGGPSLRQASLEAIEILLAAQQNVGLLEPASLEEFSRLSPPLTIRTIENPTQDLVPVADLVAESLALIESYRTFQSSGPVQPEVFENGLYAALGRGRNPRDRRRAIEQVDAQIRESFDVITIRDGQSMTLTARKLVVPLSIENNSLGDRLVLLDFTSDKVAVEEDGQTFLLPPGLTTLDITVEARALGLSPLAVEAITPDGRQSLSSTRLQIRSTAVPGLGLLLSGAALAFLVSWWIISIGRARALKHASAVDASVAADGVNVETHSTTRTT